LGSSCGQGTKQITVSFLSEDNKEVNQPMELSMFASATNQVAIDKIN
jgi:hypothetical protein